MLGKSGYENYCYLHTYLIAYCDRSWVMESVGNGLNNFIVNYCDQADGISTESHKILAEQSRLR